jgi:hypothetical protein
MLRSFMSLLSVFAGGDHGDYEHHDTFTDVGEHHYFDEHPDLTDIHDVSTNHHDVSVVHSSVSQSFGHSLNHSHTSPTFGNSADTGTYDPKTGVATFPDGTTVTNPYTDAAGQVYKSREDWLKGQNGYTPQS